MTLPPGWAEATLADLVVDPRDITDGPFGSNLKTAHYTDAGPRVIRLQNIGDGAFKDERAHISVEHFETLRKHEVIAGDVVVATLGEELPRACVAPEIGPAIVKADCIRIRPHPEVSSAYVALALNSPAVRQATAVMIRGVGRPRINLSHLRRMTIPLAPAEEQQRIVAEGERRLSRVDAAVRSLEAAQRKFGLTRLAILQAATVGAGPFVMLREVLSESMANGRSVTTLAGGFPVLRLTALRKGRVVLSERKEGAWDAFQAKNFLVHRGDFLVARGNGSLNLVGRGGLVEDVPDEVAYPDTLIRVRCDPARVHPNYLRLAWDSPVVRDQIEGQARTTAGIYKVNQQILGNIAFPLPLSIEEQGPIVDEADRRLSLLDAAERAVVANLARAETLRRGILTEAFAGRLVPQDPADEPADQLLTRIRIGRSGAPARRRRRVTRSSEV